MTLSTATRRQILKIARQQLRIAWEGAHGASHWARVRDNGLRLAETTGAHVEVVELFALLHDTQRENEYHDPEHGRRAARFAEKLAGDVFQISSENLKLLVLACEGHSDGHVEADVTVLGCG